jgi:hypothetical protein
MTVWVPLAVLAASIASRVLGVPGSITWPVLLVLLVVLIVAASLPVAALAGIAGLIGLGADIIVRSVARGMRDPVE